MAPGLTLLFDAGQYPVCAAATTGLGLRIAELAETLSRTFDVVVYSPDTTDALHLGEATLAAPHKGWSELVRTADVAFFFDIADDQRFEDAVSNKLTIISETAPPLEHAGFPSLLRADSPSRAYEAIVAGYNRQIALSDHFICRSAVEKATVVSSLMTAGRIGPDDIARSPTMDHVVTTIPIGFSHHSRLRAESAISRPKADFLWTGGLWSFYDPGVLVQAVALCATRGIDVTAAFVYGGPHPDNQAVISELDRDIDVLGMRSRVRIRHDPLRHYERDAMLKGAMGFVCIARPGVENETCVRLRLRDSRLYGVPLIVDGFGATADEVRRDGSGIVLAEPTAEALADVLAHLATGRDRRHASATYEYRLELHGLTRRLIELRPDAAPCANES
ncbi:hypothetical protein [Nonomuraea sp. NPDC049400]|uniref:hypothetical protein n=1 Tax=Nonomuraea sp. NPDC049400 TaxID=3364352 RepID=UPI0037AE393B